MLTSIQLREHAPACQVVYGRPLREESGPSGRAAVFGAGRLVAYRVDSGARVALFLFRTRESVAPDAPIVPGVEPGVDLLLTVRSRGRIALVLRMLRYLERSGEDPEAMSDAFYVRAGVVLGGRITGRNVLLSLVRHERRA